MTVNGLYMLLRSKTLLFLHQPFCQVVQMGSKWGCRSLCLLAILFMSIIDQRLAASIPSQSRSMNKSIANRTTLALQQNPNVTVLSSEGLSTGTSQQIDRSLHFKPKMSALIGHIVEHQKRG